MLLFFPPARGGGIANYILLHILTLLFVFYFSWWTEKRTSSHSPPPPSSSTFLSNSVINLETQAGDFDPKQKSLVEVLIYFWMPATALITPLQVQDLICLSSLRLVAAGSDIMPS